MYKSTACKCIQKNLSTTHTRLLPFTFIHPFSCNAAPLRHRQEEGARVMPQRRKVRQGEGCSSLKWGERRKEGSVWDGPPPTRLSLSSPDRSLVSPNVVSPHPIPPAFETTHFFPFLLSVLEVLEEEKFLVFFGIFSSSSRKHVVSCCFKQEL